MKRLDRSASHTTEDGLVSPGEFALKRALGGECSRGEEFVGKTLQQKQAMLAIPSRLFCSQLFIEFIVGSNVVVVGHDGGFQAGPLCFIEVRHDAFDEPSRK